MNSHFQKVVKPFIETPFVPTEVEKLTEEKAREFNTNISMTNAQLVGPKEEKKGSEVIKINKNEKESSHV